LLLEELLQTEDQYVKDMEYVLEHYHKEMANDGPVALMGKEHIVLGNMDEMLDFHRGYTVNWYYHDDGLIRWTMEKSMKHNL
jgi:hypothetical protein